MSAQSELSSRQVAEDAVRSRVKRSGRTQLSLLGASLALGIGSGLAAEAHHDPEAWATIVGEAGIVTIAAGERGSTVKRLKRIVRDYADADGRLGFSHNDPHKQTLLRVNESEFTEMTMHDVQADPNHSLKVGSIFESDKVAGAKRMTMTGFVNAASWGTAAMTTVVAKTNYEQAHQNAYLAGIVGIYVVASVGTGVGLTLVDNRNLINSYIRQLDNTEGNYVVEGD